MTAPQVLCVGETLWDALGAAAFLGGAPLNVAIHLARVGLRAALASRVGNDSRGYEARRRLSALGIDTSLLAVDPTVPTGTAEAKLDAGGIASYSFPVPAVWNALEADRATPAVGPAVSATVLGALALRSATE